MTFITGIAIGVVGTLVVLFVAASWVEDVEEWRAGSNRPTVHEDDGGNPW